MEISWKEEQKLALEIVIALFETKYLDKNGLTKQIKKFSTQLCDQCQK
jgi:hypothetical protein